MKLFACALILWTSFSASQVFADNESICGVIYEEGGTLYITLDEDGGDSISLNTSEYADPELFQKLQDSVGTTTCVYGTSDDDESFEVTGI